MSGISIGPVHRKDIVKASAQLEFRAMYAVVMAFDVAVDRDAREFPLRPSLPISIEGAPGISMGHPS